MVAFNSIISSSVARNRENRDLAENLFDHCWKILFRLIMATLLPVVNNYRSNYIQSLRYDPFSWGLTEVTIFISFNSWISEIQLFIYFMKNYLIKLSRPNKCLAIGTGSSQSTSSPCKRRISQNTNFNIKSMDYTMNQLFKKRSWILGAMIFRPSYKMPPYHVPLEFDFRG